MQSSISEPSHSWVAIAYAVIATSLAHLPIYYAAWKNRKTPDTTNRLSDAQAEKSLAEAHRIILDDAIHALTEARALIERRDQRIAQLEADTEELELVKAQNKVMELTVKKYEDEKKRGNGKAH